jgi:hypothetical protein
VHVVALGDNLPAQWLDVPVGSVTALTHLDNPAEVEWVMARAVYRSLSLGWSGPEHPAMSLTQVFSTLDASKQARSS